MVLTLVMDHLTLAMDHLTQVMDHLIQVMDPNQLLEMFVIEIMLQELIHSQHVMDQKLYGFMLVEVHLD